MCGILLSTDQTCSNEKFRRALNLMDHRGPDATGYMKICGVHLGHKRLKIIDLDDRSNQPFLSKNSRHVIIFNGEVYNFKELQQRHSLGGLRTACDTEVVLELFLNLGPKFVKQLDGMFSLAIVDTLTGEVFAARDRLGVKPLFIYQSAGSLVLSSEVGSILDLTGDDAVDEVGVRQYLKLRTFFNERTIYRNIKSFPAGCYMQNGKVVRYWEYNPAPQEAPEDGEIESLVRNSIDLRVMADVSVGSYLSGGVDSSIIAALCGRAHSWTVGFRGHNEFDWAKLAARHIGTDHHEVLINEGEFPEIASQMVKKRREPLSVPNEVLLYRMTQNVKRENTVVLSGEGADELFFGYDRIFRWAASAKVWDLETFAQLYSYSSRPDLEVVEDAVAPFLRFGDPLWIVSSFFQVAHLHGLLRRLDNSTMMCSVEARVPFVDSTVLIDRLAGVSAEYRMAGGIPKAPLKRIFGGLLPAETIGRPKVGFPVPLELIDFPGISGGRPFDRWLRFNLQELFGDDQFGEDILLDR